MEMEALLARIEAVDLDAAGVGEVTSVLRDLNRVTGWASTVEARATRRLAALERAGSSAPPADVLARTGRTSRRDAERAARRAEAFGAVPALEAQRARGRVSDAHGDALARAAERLDDVGREVLRSMGEQLAERAASTTPGQFDRHLREVCDLLAGDDAAADRSERQRGAATLAHGIDDRTGMGWLRAELHPDDHQRLVRRLDAEVAARRRRREHVGHRAGRLAADALVDLVTSGAARSTPPAEVVVLIDLDTLTGGTHPSSTCEYADGTPLPVATARRHACAGGTLPVVLDGDGLALDVGRTRRHATPAQRHALRAMHRTCAVDGCETSFERCEIHHLLEWDRHRGPTDLANLVPLCTFHHHRAHEGRWRLRLDPSTRTLTATLPDGTPHAHAPPDRCADRADRTDRADRADRGDRANRSDRPPRAA